MIASMVYAQNNKPNVVFILKEVALKFGSYRGGKLANI